MSTFTEATSRYRGCYTNVSRALENILSKFCIGEFILLMEISSWISTCVMQSHALGSCTKFQPEIPTINLISGVVYFHETILESSRSVSGTTPSPKHKQSHSLFFHWLVCILAEIYTECIATKAINRHGYKSAALKWYTTYHYIQYV